MNPLFLVSLACVKRGRVCSFCTHFRRASWGQGLGTWHGAKTDRPGAHGIYRCRRQTVNKPVVGTVHGVAESQTRLTDTHSVSAPVRFCICWAGAGEGETPHSVRSGKPFEGDMFDWGPERWGRASPGTSGSERFGSWQSRDRGEMDWDRVRNSRLADRVARGSLVKRWAGKVVASLDRIPDHSKREGKVLVLWLVAAKPLRPKWLSCLLFWI